MQKLLLPLFFLSALLLQAVGKRFTASSLSESFQTTTLPGLVRVQLMYKGEKDLRMGILTLAYKDNPYRWQRHLDSLALLTFLGSLGWNAMGQRFCDDVSGERVDFTSQLPGSTSKQPSSVKDLGEDLLKEVRNEIYRLQGD